MPGDGQQQKKHTDISDVRVAVEVLDVKVTRFNGQIAELTKEVKATNLAVAKLPCLVHNEAIRQLREKADKVDETNTRKVSFQHDLFRSVLAALVGALATYIGFFASM